MILSKGQKRIYSCPQCSSRDIEKLQTRGGHRLSCNSCGYYAPWRMRGSERVLIEYLGFVGVPECQLKCM